MNKPEKELIQVLDKGYVKYIRHMGDDLSPVEDARMSTGNPTGVDKIKDDKLRKRLWDDQHTSSFEGCVLCIELKLPLFVLRQIERHRTLDINDVEITSSDDFRKYTSRNEFSGRYAEFKDEFYIPTPERLVLQDVNNKQASGRRQLNESDCNFVIECLTENRRTVYKDYDWLLNIGVSKEVARMALPGAIYTKIRITANMLNWFKFLKLRLAEDAQWEVREYAKAIASIIQELWPDCFKLFSERIER